MNAPTEKSVWRDDVRVLWRMLRGKPAGDHAAALDAFYSPQADAYDRFRERLLPGREAFMRNLPLHAGARVADFGAGTGQHWTYAPDLARALARLDLVDLCTPLLAVARRRFADRANIACHLADATTWRADALLDAVVFSYSLSMMPDWRAVLGNAAAQLKPGGCLALIDFCVPPAEAPAPMERVSAFARGFWPRWFAHDGVMLREAVVPTLFGGGETILYRQGRARLPYLPLSGVPWFAWIGRPQPGAFR